MYSTLYVLVCLAWLIDDLLFYLAGCYPFTDMDPFLIESCPHVYFVGNQDKYDSRLLTGIPLHIHHSKFYLKKKSPESFI